MHLYALHPLLRVCRGSRTVENLMKRVCLGATKLLMVITIMLIIVYGRGITAKAVNVTYEKEKVINLVNKKMTGYINAINIKVEQWKRDEALNDMANHF